MSPLGGASAVFKTVPAFFPETKGGVTGIVGAAGGLGVRAEQAPAGPAQQ